MRINKIGHCCLLIEHKGKRILTDPGNWSQGQEQLHDIDVILITHDHADHCHIDSIAAIMKNNPDAQIITNATVSKRLGYNVEVLQNGRTQCKGITIEAYGTSHATIYSSLPPLENTGFFIDDVLFYPGDAFIEPQKHVRILALAVEAPWLKLTEAIDYAKKVKPEISFPVHDGRLRPDRVGASYRIPEAELNKIGIRFIPLGEHASFDFD